MSEVALERPLLSPCVFHCRQALEKLLKALWIEKSMEGFPPRRHDLVALSKEVGLELTEEQNLFLDDLSSQYKPSRYGDVAAEYTWHETATYLAKTRELFQWLQQRLS